MYLLDTEDRCQSDGLNRRDGKLRQLSINGLKRLLMHDGFEFDESFVATDIFFTDRVSGEGNAIGSVRSSVYPSTRLFPLHLSNQSGL